MAKLKNKSKLYCLSVYVNDERLVKKIERAAKIENRTVSSFLAVAGERWADEVIEERKRIAAERQLGELSA